MRHTFPVFSTILHGGSTSGGKFGGQWRFRKEALKKCLQSVKCMVAF